MQEVDDPFDIGEFVAGETGFVPVVDEWMGNDGQEAFDEAVFVAGLEFLDDAVLDAPDDADDGCTDDDLAGFPVIDGHERLVIPEGEVFLAVVSPVVAVLVHGTNDADEFITDDGDSG